MALIAIDAHGNTVSKGDTIKDFRGDEAVFETATRAVSPGKSGKVLVTRNGFTQEFYDKVFELTVTEA